MPYKSTKILIPFDMLVDTDHGIVQVVKENYMNTKYINRVMISDMTDERIFSMLIGRKSYNIMDLLLKPEYHNSSELIYNQIKDDNYLDVIKKSCITNVTQLLEQFLEKSEVDVNILCKNVIEEQYIRENIKQAKIIVANKLDKIDISSYDGIFLKNIRDAQYLNTKGMCLYIANCRYNFGESVKENDYQVEILREYVKPNTEIKTVDLYTIKNKDIIH